MSSDEFFHAEELCRDRNYSAAIPRIRAILDATPEHTAAWRLYAEALRELGQDKDAADAERRADVIEADHTAEVGASLLFHGDETRARALFERALALDTDCLSAHWLLGDIESRNDNKTAAIEHYERCLEIAPDRNGPTFMIAALGEEAAPTHAPADYLVDYFDWYAGHFDEHLTENLNYTGPQQVGDALRAARPGGVGHAIDLGCGTGLVGVSVRDVVGRLTGVDLSAGMLRRAAERGLYEALEEADLLTALQAQADASVDAVLAADVFVYVGDLAPLLAESRRVLAPGGVFIATFEAAGPGVDTWRLERTGRYTHARGYLEEIARETGFVIDGISDVVLREEYGEPVRSHLTVFTVPA